MDVQTFDSQVGVEMDVHESQLVPQTTSTQLLAIQFFF
jgi:hypothetical protein